MRYLVLALALVLSACGGGGSSSSPAEASAPSAPVVVAFYGDSTVEAPFSANNFVMEAQAVLGPGYVLKNEGVSGTYSQQLLDGTDGKHPAWPAEMAKSPASLVIINHAINDHFYSLAQYRVNLVSLVTIAQGAGKRVMLQTPNPMTTASLDLVAFGERVATMREVATQTGAALCDQYAAITAAGMVSDLLDGVHPDPTLFTFMGGVSAGCIRAHT